MNNNSLSECSNSTKQFSVNWSNHMNHVRSVFDTLLTDSELVDVTLYCDGHKTGAHKVLLSACSTYFREVFKEIPSQHPVIILKGVEFQVLQDILKFIYNGEVSIDSDNFDAFIKTAQFLQISGLTEGNSSSNNLQNEEDTQNTGLSFGNQHIIKRSSLSSQKQKSSHPEDTKPPPLKKYRNNDNNTALTADNIKCEPEEAPSYMVDNVVDPLHTDLHLDHEDTKNNVSQAQYSNTLSPSEPVYNDKIVSDSIQDYKDNTQFESVYVPSESVTSPVRQSAFSESSLKCNICQKVFSHPYSLHHHKAVHSGSTECPICHAVLSRKYNLKIHMKARHNV